MPLIDNPNPEILTHRETSPTYAYYNEDNARDLKVILDAMMIDGHPRSFSCAKYKLTIGSLEKKINRAFLYLIDKLDTAEGRYKNFRRKVVVSKDTKANAVNLYFKFYQLENFTTGVVIIDDRKRKRDLPPFDWQTPLDDFICEAPPGSEIRIDELELTPDQVVSVRAGVAGLTDVDVIEISAEKIVMRKKKEGETTV